jgi:hypothetical protein
MSAYNVFFENVKILGLLGMLKNSKKRSFLPHPQYSLEFFYRILSTRRVGNFRQHNYTAEDGKDGTNGIPTEFRLFRGT